MRKRFSKFIVPGVLLAIGFIVAVLAFYKPGYLSSATYLGALIFLQILLAAVWKYEQRFFPLMVMVFLWAGMSVPFSAIWTSGRWGVLAVGAIAGFALYVRSARPSFSGFHMVAMFAVVSALVSSSVSSFGTVSFLKALSLLLLFLYASTGARLALAGRELKFFPRLLFFIEIFVYLSAVAYLVLRVPIYGNPNSLGALMGVVAVPLLFWGVLTAEGKTAYRRMIFAFIVAVGLLFFSQARAGILAAVVSCCLTCVALRRYRLLLQGAIAFICVAALAIALTPSSQTEDMPMQRENSSLAATFLYKGHEEGGVLGSRVSPWDQTVSVIQQHPWFGSGFGTRLNSSNEDIGVGRYSTVSAATSEHGNSYLAIMEGVGLLGLLPFAALIVMLAVKVCSAFAWLRRTGNSSHCVVPVAMVLAAGLIHAGFEDWLFAVGYYLSVFFWVLAFAFLDILPASARAPAVGYRPITDFSFRALGRDAQAVAPER
ncbi:MAG: O-antigen ligase family protein [Terriglobales bacterium]